MDDSTLRAFSPKSRSTFLLVAGPELNRFRAVGGTTPSLCCIQDVNSEYALPQVYESCGFFVTCTLAEGKKKRRLL